MTTTQPTKPTADQIAALNTIDRFNLSMYLRDEAAYSQSQSLPVTMTEEVRHEKLAFASKQIAKLVKKANKNLATK